jgi:sulfatase modifying factor 1
MCDSRSIQQIWTSFLSLVIAGVFCVRGVAEEGEFGGLVAAQPSDGHFVVLSEGYMVPYTANIPGTHVSFQMIPIPGNSLEKVSPFWIGKYEVTLREYREFAKLYDYFKSTATPEIRRIPEGRRIDAVSAPTPIYDPRGRFEGVVSLDCPAYSMTLFAAKQYTKWLSLISESPYRLPTEPEWELACGGGTGENYWDEDQLQRVAVFGGETDNVLPVGSRQSNAWGLHDMFGNVSEWVITAFPNSPGNNTSVAQTSESNIWPPVWISKGGNFASKLQECTAAHRFVVTAEEWNEEANVPLSTTWLGSHSDRVRIGFRVVRQLGQLDKQAMAKYWDTQSPYYREQIDEKLRDGRGAEGLVSPSTTERIGNLATEPQSWIGN